MKLYARLCLQEVRQVEQAGTNSACWRTEFGLICLQQPDHQPQQASQSDQSKVPEAVTQPDKLRTEFGEISTLSPSSNAEIDASTDRARTVKTEFGQVKLLDSRQGPSAETTQAQLADSKPNQSSELKQAQPANSKHNQPAQTPAANGSKQSTQPVRSLNTEFGEVRILGEPLHASLDMPSLPAACVLPRQASFSRLHESCPTKGNNQRHLLKQCCMLLSVSRSAAEILWSLCMRTASHDACSEGLCVSSSPSSCTLASL